MTIDKHFDLKDLTLEQACNKAYPSVIIEQPVFYKNGNEEVKSENYKSILAIDTESNSINELAIMKQSYEVVHPYQAFDCFKPLVDSGRIKLVKGGSTRNGKTFYLQGEIDSKSNKIGEEIRTYLTFATAFDGGMSVTVKDANQRIVCKNTLAIALKENSDHCFRFRHTASVHQRLEHAQQYFMKVIKNTEQSINLINTLIDKKIDSKSVNSYIRTVFELPQDTKLEGKIAAKVNRVLELMDDQTGLQPAMIGSAWQAYNAVTQYLTHEYGHNETSRLDSNLFGEANRINKLAFQSALSM